MVIYHFVDQFSREYVVISDGSVPAEDHTKPGYTLRQMIKCAVKFGNFELLPLDVPLSPDEG